LKESDHGQYLEFKDEKEVLKRSANEPLCVIHFFHPDFKKCAVMDKHLSTLASKHFDTLFLKVSVMNVPFIVEKLQIQILPCVIMFVKGIAKDRIIGFEGLTTNSSDDFPTSKLELRLSQSGAISLNSTTSSKVGSGSTSYNAAKRNDDD